jgi:uncharacterized protein (DUF58 family)
MKIITQLYLTNRFFIAFALVVVSFCVSFALPSFFLIAQGLLALLFFIFIADALICFRLSLRINASRKLSDYLSLGDENAIHIMLSNDSKAKISVEILEDLPEQFQERNMLMQVSLKKQESKELIYHLRPLSRGKYHFGFINIFVNSPLRLSQYRTKQHKEEMVKVYPSIIQMRKCELMLSDKTAHGYGSKKIRRIGHSYEFEKIKNYVEGDDIRSINWKATGRRDTLMVNQYEDEKSQSVYCVIDKSRSMMLPFDGLSLLDYSINTALALSNMVIRKHDKAGLITFSNKPETLVKADSRNRQMGLILESLYQESENKLEANYEQLFLTISNSVKNRSLLFLFSNFESLHAVQRVLPLLRKISQRHLLVLMLFENTEIENYSKQAANSMEDMYLTTIAEKFIYDKYRILQELKSYGIQVVINKPNDLSINAINKYIELKSRGRI